MSYSLGPGISLEPFFSKLCQRSSFHWLLQLQFPIYILFSFLQFSCWHQQQEKQDDTKYLCDLFYLSTVQSGNWEILTESLISLIFHRFVRRDNGKCFKLFLKSWVRSSIFFSTKYAAKIASSTWTLLTAEVLCYKVQVQYTRQLYIVEWSLIEVMLFVLITHESIIDLHSSSHYHGYHQDENEMFNKCVIKGGYGQ